MTAPAWASSVSAFTSAVNNSAAVTTASQMQFPDTSQLGGLCGGLMGGSSFTNGLVDAGDLNGGTAGALVGGTQGFADGLCGLMGGSGEPNTSSPQAITAGAQNVSDAVNNTPMASGTIAMGGSSGNTALDAINGGQVFANNLYSTVAPCGCGGGYAPSNVTPDQVIGAASDTSSAVQASPMAMGIIAAGGSGSNVALNAINGTQRFANSLFSIVSCCGGGYNPQTATPESVVAAAQGTANAVTGSTVGAAALALGGSSGNVATDLVNGADIWFTGVASTAHTAGATAVSAQASAQQSATAAANVAAAVSAAQSAAIANDAIGGDYTTIVPVGTAGTALPGGSWSATGPSTGNVDIEGNYGFAGIPPSLPAGTYWAMPAFTYQTDSQYIAVVLGDEGGPSNAYTTLYFHCTSGFTQGAYLAISNTGFTLGTFTYSSGTFSYSPFSGGGMSMLLISGQTVAVQNIGTAFTVSVNSQPILDFTTGSVTMNSSHRHGAVSMTRVLETV